MIYKDIRDFLNAVEGLVTISEKGVVVTGELGLRQKVIDEIVYNIVVNENEQILDSCQWFIWELGRALGIYPSSIQGLYEARGRDEYRQITVPAVNLRGLTYNGARALIRTANKFESSTFIFEIAKSEIGYTFQRPAEYASVCLAAAIREGYHGPLFIQGDHFQANAKRYLQDPKAEIDGLRELIEKAIEAGFYNIDIDSSTLVDLSKATVGQQQRPNFEVAASLTAFIRGLEPQGITISVGAEIGEIGGKNSTEEELRAFMDGYRGCLEGFGKGIKGISKISVQTGTTHGGVVLADGSIARVKLDFETLGTLSKVAREGYGLAGAVQHGASTLPDEAFHRFPQTETTEIHLATGFQNMIYESSHFPQELRQMMYEWLKKECAGERKEGQTEEQFIYKTRKKAFGPFKRQITDLPCGLREAIGEELESKFDFLFKKLNAINTRELVKKYVQIVEVPKKIPLELSKALGPP